MTKTKILYVEDELYLGKIVKESLESRDFEVKMLTYYLLCAEVIPLKLLVPMLSFTVGLRLRRQQLFNTSLSLSQRDAQVQVVRLRVFMSNAI